MRFVIQGVAVTRFISIALGVVWLISACTSTASIPVVTVNEPTAGKPTAPVTVTAEIAERHARVTVRFDRDVTGARVAISGVDGLVVDGPEVRLEGGAFKRGETRVFDVAWTAPATRASLAVAVSASFQGVRRARVAAFTVGAGPAPASSGQVITTDQGDRIKLTTP